MSILIKLLISTHQAFNMISQNALDTIQKHSEQDEIVYIETLAHTLSYKLSLSSFEQARRMS